MTREKRTGAVKRIVAYSHLEPMPERAARKTAWACDYRPGVEVRIRPVGDTDIGEPHSWLEHAPSAFFARLDERVPLDTVTR